MIDGGKRGRYDWSAACSHAFRPSSVFPEDKEGVRGEEANCGHIYIGARHVQAPLAASWAVLSLQETVFGGFKALFWGLNFLMVFRIHFCWVFGANLGPTWPPKSTKIDETSMPRCLRVLTLFFDRFLIDFCSQLRPPEPSKLWFFLRKNEIFFNKSPFEDNIDLGSIFEAKLGPF